MAPLTWIRNISNHIEALQEIPLFGNSAPFDWNAFAQQLTSALAIDTLKLKAQGHGFKEGDAIFEGLAEDLFKQAIEITPLGSAYWVMSRKDIQKITSWLLKPTSKTRAISSEILQEGFYQYLLLEALNTVQEMVPFTDVTLQMTDEKESLPLAFCIDVEIDFEGKSAWGRLILPEQLRKNWVSHFSHMQKEYIPTQLAKETELTLKIKTGSVRLSQEEWAELELGDFLLLDEINYNPTNQTGSAQLLLAQTPLFRGLITERQLELTEYALTPEDPMNDEQMPIENSTEEITAIKQVPLNITVEMGKIKLSLDQLMNLTPGQVLDLPSHPDQGVSLVLNGQKVGRAELIYLGEKLGVRILELG